MWRWTKNLWPFIPHPPPTLICKRTISEWWLQDISFSLDSFFLLDKSKQRKHSSIEVPNKQKIDDIIRSSPRFNRIESSADMFIDEFSITIGPLLCNHRFEIIWFALTFPVNLPCFFFSKIKWHRKQIVFYLILKANRISFYTLLILWNDWRISPLRKTILRHSNIDLNHTLNRIKQ